MKVKVVGIVLAAGAVAGCISLPGMKAEWRPSYLVEARRPAAWAAAETGLTNYVLRLKRFRVAAPFDSRAMMVLDAADNAIAPMEGGRFAVPLAPAFTSIAREWLAASGGFADVVDPAALPAGGFLTLDGWVDQAGVVVDGEGTATFRLRMSIWLLPQPRDEAFARCRYDYSIDVPLKEAAPAGAAAAAGQAIGEVMAKLEGELKCRKAGVSLLP